MSLACSALATDLKGKTILITGASRGIGHEIAQQALKEGAYVIAHYYQSKKEVEKLEKLSSKNQLLLVQGNLNKKNAAQKLFQHAFDWRGNLDILVNNAGALYTTGFNEKDDVWQNAWENAIQTNLISAAQLSRKSIQMAMKKSAELIIINISSRAALRGSGTAENIQYAASKAGMLTMTKSLARTYAGDGIYVYAIAPGFVLTDMVTEFTNKYGAEATEQVKQSIPMQSFIPPSEIGNLVMFLAKGKLKHATGSTFDITGASYLR